MIEWTKSSDGLRHLQNNRAGSLVPADGRLALF